MKIAITIATYQRSDGKTPTYLQKLMDSIFAQTHQDFRIYLIGDKYENQDEWYSIISRYCGRKLCAVNLNYAKERDKYKNTTTLWSCGGVNAANFGADLALSEGFQYINHIDHDDYLAPDHLYWVNKGIEEIKVDWICSKAEYGQDRVLPEVDKSNWEFLPFEPISGGVINSSVCYNYVKIPLRYRNMYEETGMDIPSDADLWDRTNKFIKENKLLSCLINKVTCYHKEEGFLLYG